MPRRAGRQQREKRAALFSEHCMESQEGKQDLGFIGVILGNREIDSQIFILSECVCQLAPIVPRGHPVPRQHYPHTLNTGKVLTLAWLHLLLCISSLVVCRITKQAACSGRKGCQPCPLSTEMLARARQTPETWSLWEQRAKNKQETFHDLPTNMNHVSPKTLHMPPVMIPGHS